MLEKFALIAESFSLTLRQQKKIQARSKELGLFGLAKKTKVAKVGNSLAIRIPKEIVDFMKLKKEEEVKIVPKSQKELVIGIG